MASRRLILIGGSAGAGKTTVARSVAQHLDADWLQVDSVWMTIRSVLPEDSAERRLLTFDEAIRSTETSPDQLVEKHIEAGRLICKALPSVLDFHIHCRDTVVADGAWLLPEFMANVQLPETQVTPLVIHERDPAEVKRAMRSRSELPQTTPFQAKGAVLSWQYGNYLAAEAERFGIRVVAARPRETLLERVLEAVR